MVAIGVGTYGIKPFCWCQNPYGFDGSLKIENLSVSTFFELTKTRAYCMLGEINFGGLFLKRRREARNTGFVRWTSVGGQKL